MHPLFFAVEVISQKLPWWISATLEPLPRLDPHLQSAGYRLSPQPAVRRSAGSRSGSHPLARLSAVHLSVTVLSCCSRVPRYPSQKSSDGRASRSDGSFGQQCSEKGEILNSAAAAQTDCSSSPARRFPGSERECPKQ